MKNQRGFTLPLLLWMIPILVGLAGWMGLQLLQLRELKADRLLCRARLIPAQEEVGKNISSLLKLNSTAQSLRLQMTAAKTALALAIAAVNLPAARAAQLQIRRINAQKKVLILRQRQLQWMAKAHLNRGLFEVQKELQSRYQESTNRKRPLFNLKLDSFQASSARVAVVRRNSPDPFPEYELAPNFVKRQALNLKWQTTFRQKSSGFKNWIPFDQKKNVYCGVTLQERGFNFEVIPAQEKYF